MPNYHLITMYQTPPVVIDFSNRNIKLLSTDGTPKDIKVFQGYSVAPTPKPDIILRPTPDPLESLSAAPALPGTYPAVGDVDMGVKYGPNGTDYTGTLVQPAIGDVKKDVMYGAGGAEFTGTLVGGVGGAYETIYTPDGRCFVQVSDDVYVEI